MTMIPEPRVRVATTFTFTYVRPRKGGWPLLTVESMFEPAGYAMAPSRITVVVTSRPEATAVLTVSTLGKWVSTGQQTSQMLDLPGRARRHSTVAPPWVTELTEDALARAKAHPLTP